MNNDNLDFLYQKLTARFRFERAQLFDPEAACRVTNFGTKQLWASALAAMVAKQLVEIGGEGIAKNGTDTQYRLAKEKSVDADQAQKDILTLLVARYGSRNFPEEDARNALPKELTTHFAATFAAIEKKWWLMRTGNRLCHFCLARIPFELGGDKDRPAPPPTKANGGRTREERLYLLWKMGDPRRVKWSDIRIAPLEIRNHNDLHHFLADELDRGEFFSRRQRAGMATFFHWRQEPPKFQHLDHLLE